MSTASEQPHEFKVIGTRPVRHDGVEKVIGRAKYGADYSMPEMLWAKVLRSPHAHARIKSISTARALAHPGVKAVLTYKDFPPIPEVGYRYGGVVPYNPRHLAQNLIANDKVLYHGHGVAIVAATSPHVAEEALDLIDVEYEVLPAVLDVMDAMKPDAPLLHDDIKDEAGKPSNVARHIHYDHGDLEKGFKEADVIVEHEFRTETVHQGYIEPHNALAYFEPDGKAVVYCSTQGPFDVRAMCSDMTGIPVSDIKVVPAEIGGGFGAKLLVYYEPLALMLSKITAHPVKMVMTRAEVQKSTGPTPGAFLKCKMGAKRDGKITAAEVWMAYEAGAFPGSVVYIGCMTAISAYEVENYVIDGYDVVMNRPRTGAYRAPGATQSAFAVESAIDELAQKLGMDPIDIRLKNSARTGSRTLAGPPQPRIGFLDVLETLKNSDHYKSKLTGKLRGRGLAVGAWHTGGMQSSAMLNIHVDGTASLVTGAVDIGGSRAACAMVAAEVLGIPVTSVRPAVTDTDSIGYTDPTAGSRTGATSTLAAMRAAEDAVRDLKERAAKIWELTPADIDWIDGKAVSKNNGKAPLTLKEIAAKALRTGGPICGRANIVGPGGGPNYSAVLVDVEVDPDTSKVQVLRCTIAQDVGRAIHPSYVESQMQGGTSQGIGWALNEEYIYDQDGHLRNVGFLDYRMPTCLDLPMIETIMVEVPNPSHPLGVRGVGEVPIVPPPAAVANAVSRALGMRITQLPMSPSRLHELRKRQGL
jgi:xanthine dehydrogenase molybdenum-binding subunit